MSDTDERERQEDLADIQTQLKRSYYRGTGLRLTREQVRELYERDSNVVQSPLNEEREVVNV